MARRKLFGTTAKLVARRSLLNVLFVVDDRSARLARRKFLGVEGPSASLMRFFGERSARKRTHFTRRTLLCVVIGVRLSQAPCQRQEVN